MTNATKLADALVEAGIITPKNLKHTFFVLPDGDTVVPLEEAITDWRVAGKVLESMWVDVCHNSPEFLDFVNERINGKSIHELPRAIIEAWYEATRYKTSDKY